jgi:hypothetical protein
LGFNVNNTGTIFYLTTRITFHSFSSDGKENSAGRHFSLPRTLILCSALNVMSLFTAFKEEAESVFLLFAYTQHV